MDRTNKLDLLGMINPRAIRSNIKVVWHMGLIACINCNWYNSSSGKKVTGSILYVRSLSSGFLEQDGNFYPPVKDQYL